MVTQTQRSQETSQAAEEKGTKKQDLADTAS